MEHVNCILCGSEKRKKLFGKPSKKGEIFTLVRCRSCGLEYVMPRPALDEIASYYTADYFTTRTDRGYNDYFSGAVRSEIERVMELNLADLGFFEFEKKLSGERRSIDIGCAAGYFVNYMKNRGWDSRGIDISAECVDFAKKAGLNALRGDYLAINFSEKFDLITLWASIEHLHRPDLFLEKIRGELASGGMLYLSTCRTGGANFKLLHCSGWRYYNFPEHLCFFSAATIRMILEKHGFAVVTYRTYGSGTGRPGSAVRRLSDLMAKKLYLGDMMLVSARKR